MAQILKSRTMPVNVGNRSQKNLFRRSNLPHVSWTSRLPNAITPFKTGRKLFFFRISFVFYSCHLTGVFE